MAKKSGFKYRGRDRSVESVVRKSKQSGGNFDRMIKEDCPGFKVRDGENCVRIMPLSWEDLDKWGDGWEIPIEVHYGIGPDEQQYFCLDKMQGKACPICDARGNAESEEEVSELKSTWRALCWVIDRDNEKAGPMVWSMPMTVFKEINLRSVDRTSNTPILIDDPEEGFDIIFNKEGTGLRTKYTAFEIVRDSSPLNEDEDKQQSWLDYITENAIPDILKFYEYDHIEKVLFGKGSSKPDDEDEEEAPRSTRRRRHSRDETEDEEEEKPSPSRRRRRAQEEEEDDVAGKEEGEEQEDNAEEEEEEAPRKSRRRKVKDAEEDSEDEDEDEPSTATRRRLRSMKGRKHSRR